MIFKLVAVFFLVVSGQVAPQPSAKFTNKTVFPTEAACMNYFDTEQGKLSRQALEAMAKQDDLAYKIEYSCEKTLEETL